MSTPIAQYKLPSHIEIGFDSEAKASIADLKIKLDEFNKSLNARDSGLWLESKRKSNSRIGQIVADAISNQIKETSPPDGLLKAMQAEAANDSAVLNAPMSVPWESDLERAAVFDIATADDADTAISVAIAASNMPELKQLGQWVFVGQDEKWQSAAVDKNGDGYLYSCDKSILRLCGHGTTHKGDFDTYLKAIGTNFDTTDWKNSAIDRETVNDVDYLSENDLDECVPYLDINNNSPCWMFESVPQITQTDMQLIFIKNLSECLIQRMHSMNRFSEDDYAIGGNDLKAWDIIVDCDGLFGFAVCDLIHHESNLLNRVRILRLKKFQDTTFTHGAIINGWRMDDINWHTITEDQLPAFRVALEACYA